jgi:hypothetical protein
MGWMRRAGSATLAAILLVGPVVPVQAQDPPPPPSAIQLTGEEVDCIVADSRYAQLSATIQPPDLFVKPKLFFKSAVSDFFYVDLTPGVGNFVGKLPPAKMEAQTITYYFSVFGKDGSETRTGEVTARVVKNDADCKKPAGVAPGGAPTVLTAAGLPATAIGGFAAGAAAAGFLGLSTTSLIIGGAIVAGGVTTAIILSGDNPPASPSR